MIQSLIGFPKVLFGLFLVSIACLGAAQADGIDPAKLEPALKGEGLVGWMHGAISDRGLYVFTYRDPNDFFKSAEFPVVTHVPAVIERLKTLNRHDRIKIKGQFIRNGAPIVHIYVSDLEILGTYNDGIDVPPYQYSEEALKELMAQTEVLAKVHAISGEGRILVIEYKDAVVPIFVEETSVSKNLHRGDTIRLQYVVRDFPNRPPHLSPDLSKPAPIQIRHKITEDHGKTMSREGILVMFPKSPQISVDVFAVQYVDSDGIGLEYTLVNFESAEIFEQIRAKLKAAWDRNSGAVVSGRNKLLNPKIRVKATGMINVQAQNQANPQILVADPADIEIAE